MQKNNIIVALFFLITGCIGLAVARNYPFGGISHPEAGFFPVLISGLMIVMSLTLLVQTALLPTKSAAPPYPWRKVWTLALPAAGIVAYTLLLETLGFLICNFLMVIPIAKSVGNSWRTTLIVSFLTSILFYAFFRWYLQSPLPQGLIPI